MKDGKKLFYASLMLIMKHTNYTLLETGGTLGFYCAHRYAHTREGIDTLMPFALKGIDAVFFSVFRSLGLKVNARPMLNFEHFGWFDKIRLSKSFSDYEKNNKYPDQGGDSQKKWGKRQKFGSDWHKKRREITRVGDAFHELRLGDVGGHDDDSEMIAEVSEILKRTATVTYDFV